MIEPTLTFFCALYMGIRQMEGLYRNSCKLSLRNIVICHPSAEVCQSDLTRAITRFKQTDSTPILTRVTNKVTISGSASQVDTDIRVLDVFRQINQFFCKFRGTVLDSRSLQFSHSEKNTEQNDRIIQTFSALKTGPLPFEVRKRFCRNIVLRQHKLTPLCMH